MNIGFDLDKVFIDTPPFIPDRIIERFYKKKSNGVLLYRIPSKAWQTAIHLTHFPLFRPAIKNNLAVLRNIAKKDNKLYLISSRFKFLEGSTKKLIQKYKLDTIFDGMYFNFANEQPHEFKDEVIKKLHLDMYIDDDLSLLHYVAKHNQGTRFYWLNHAAQKKPLERNVFAIEKLEEIFK